MESSRVRSILIEAQLELGAKMFPRQFFRREFVKKISCDHSWSTLHGTQSDRIFKLLEEKQENGSFAQGCKSCGAVCIREGSDLSLVVYDSTKDHFVQKVTQ